MFKQLVETIRKDITGAGAELSKKHSASADIYLRMKHPAAASKVDKLARINRNRRAAGLPPLGSIPGR